MASFLALPRRTTALLTASAALGAAALTAGLPGAALAGGKDDAPGQQKKSFEIGLVGDMPYADYGRSLYPNVVDDLNGHDLAFSIFDGDTKNGSESCFADPHATTATATPESAVSTSPYGSVTGFAQGQDVYKYALGLFNTFRQPVVYLPGDNEWTDCDRSSLSHTSDSLDRLQYLRRLSYPTDRSLGQKTIGQVRQDGYPENVRWTKGPVTFVGLNVTGSDNNFISTKNTAKDGPIDEAVAEYTARNAANLQWIKDSFAAAKAAGSKGVMLAMQADMWDPSAVTTHFQDTKDELVRQVTAFDGPVVLVNGDSHSFETDKPLVDAATTNAAGKAGVGNVVQNFTRVTTFGEYQYHWVSATIDPSDPEVFSFHQHLVPQDVPTYQVP